MQFTKTGWREGTGWLEAIIFTGSKSFGEYADCWVFLVVFLLFGRNDGQRRMKKAGSGSLLIDCT